MDRKENYNTIFLIDICQDWENSIAVQIAITMYKNESDTGSKYFHF